MLGRAASVRCAVTASSQQRTGWAPVVAHFHTDGRANDVELQAETEEVAS